MSATCLQEDEWVECAFEEIPPELMVATEAHQYEPMTVDGDERREPR